MAKIYVQNTETLFIHSGSLAIAACVSASVPCQGYAKIVGGFRTDATSETGSGVRIEQSFDRGANWSLISSSALGSACAASSFDISVVGDYARFVWKNGAAAASNAFANIYLRPI